MHQKILHNKIWFYNLHLGPGKYFKRGRFFVFGKFQGFRFLYHSISGSQSLWIPLKPKIGLKIFHPKGFSGTLQKAWTHFKVQKILSDVDLAPEPISLLKLEVHLDNSNVVVASNPLDVKFVKSGNITGSPWQCYGIMMNRVLRGSVKQVLENLKVFGVKSSDFVHQTVIHYLSKRNDDALNLYEYQKLCYFFGVNEESYIQKILKNIKERMPPNVDEGIDMFSLPNIVIDDNGKYKVVDCDLSSIKIC